jgi:kynureninase
MDLTSFVERLRNGTPPKFPADANTLAFAQKLDSEDQLRHLRDEFVLPTRGSLKKKALDGSIPGESPQLAFRHVVHDERAATR